MKWTEAILQDAIEAEFGSKPDPNGQKGHACVVCNLTLPGWTNESDMVSVTKSNYIWEYEMKISKPDFLRDVKKYRHKHYQDPEYRKDRKPNRFWYVMPARWINKHWITLVNLNCVPSYAGVLGVSAGKDGTWIHKMKPAPLLHKQKVGMEQIAKMADVARWRMWDLRHQVKALQAMIDGPRKGE